MEFRLLAVDVDGTLTPSYEVPVSARVANILRRAQERIHVVLCTGRSPGEVSDLLEKQLRLAPSWHVLGGGSVILSPANELRQYGILTESEVETVIAAANQDRRLLYLLSEAVWHHGASARTLKDITAISFHTLGADHEREIKTRLAPLREQFLITTVSGAPGENMVVYISAKSVSKGSGLSLVQRELGVTPADTLVIGDAPNDLPMFEVAGLRVAMGNASAWLQDKADYVTDSVFDDGVANAIERFIFEDENA